MAFSLTPAGGDETVGVVSVHAFTDVNVDARTVLLSGPTVTGTHFPSLDAGAAERMDRLVRTFLPPNSSIVISLDRLVASVEKLRQAHGFRPQRPAGHLRQLRAGDPRPR